MKRLFVFILIVILLCCLKMFFLQNLTIYTLFGSCDAVVFVANPFNEVSNCIFFTKDFDDGVNVVKNGTGSVIYCRSSSIYRYKLLFSVTGYTIRLHNHKNEILDLLLARNVFENNWGTYGYSDKLEFERVIDGVVVNFQINKTNTGFLLGCPILLGDY